MDKDRNIQIKYLVFIIILFLNIEICQSAFCQELTASWYSIESLKKEGTYKYSKGVMANGKIFDENAFTCATRDFPLKTRLRITNIKDKNKSVEVEVTDKIGKRFAGKRIDLSKRAFMEIADCEQGLCKVEVEVLK